VTPCISVRGAHPVGGVLAQALESWADPPDALVVGWAHERELWTFDSEYRRWLLVEGSDDGLVIGPAFGSKATPCLYCYAARRRANGSVSCVPPGSISPAVVNAARQVVVSEEHILSAGRQVVCTDGGDRIVHVLTAVPSCQRCARSLHPAPIGITDLVSDRVGLVHRVEHAETEFAGLVSAVAVPSRTNAFTSTAPWGVAWAVGRDRPRTSIRAIGESVEHYCARVASIDGPIAAARDLDGPFVDTSTFGFLKGEQRHDIEVRWTKGTRLSDGAVSYAPSTLVTLPYRGRAGERTAEYQCSTGLGAGESFEAAAAHGLLEAIERDAFIRAWQSDSSVQRVRPPQRIAGGTMHLIRLPNQAGVEVVVGLLEREEPPYCAVGLAARLDREEAIEAATYEVAQTYTAVKARDGDASTESLDPPTSLFGHALAHAVRRDLRSSRSKWITAVDEARPARKTSLDDVLARIPTAVAVDLTTSDAKSAGVFVARVLISGYSLAGVGGGRVDRSGAFLPQPLA
jgi:ribosomal protein S12 methylthiotransferase accessory factor